MIDNELYYILDISFNDIEIPCVDILYRAIVRRFMSRIFYDKP